MYFTISKSDFSKLLYLTSSIVERRNTMPILSNVKLTAENNKLSIAATDLEVSLIGEAKAEVKTPGSITVDAKVLYEIVRELPSSNVTGEVSKGGRLEIECGKSKFKINGVSSDEFPSIMGTQLENPAAVEASKLFEMIEKTSFSISTDETRYNINGVYAETIDKGENIRFVSTDGHRLSIIDRPAEGLNMKKPVIIPKKGILELKKVLESNEGSAQVGFSEGFITVKCDGIALGARLVDGQFPDYSQVIPSGHTTIIEANRAELLSCVKRVSLLTTDKSKAIKFRVEGDALTVSSSSPEYGEANDSLNVKKDGDDLAIGFSARYVIDVLNAMGDCETIKMTLNGELGPGVFTGNDNTTYRCIVMPMRFE